MNRPPHTAMLGKYRILGTLGRGSMGVVYKAEDPGIGRVVAIKTLRRLGGKKFQDAEAALERFRNEARSAGKLRHPNIITIFDASINEDTPYIVMDYVEGTGLDSLIHANPPLPPARALRILSQIAEALDEAHRQGVIHRDIKPSNIVVDAKDRPYILDFGVAKLNESIQGELVDQPKEPVMGTPAYMSPEQILNRPLDSRSDLFSFAILSYELLTGSRPFPGENFQEVVNSILHLSPIPITTLVKNFPLQLEVEFEHLLAKRPEERPESAKEVVRIIRDSLKIDEKSVYERGVREEPRIRKPSEWRSLGVHDAANKSSRRSEGAGRSSGSQNAGGAKGAGNVSSSESHESGNHSAVKRELIPIEKKLPSIERRASSQEFIGSQMSSPGDLFSHEEGEVSQRVRFRQQISPLRILILLFSIISIAAAVLLLTALFQGKDPSEMLGISFEEEEEFSSDEGPLRQKILAESHQTKLLPSSEGEVRALSGKDLAELSEDQVLALVLSDESELNKKLEGLKEIRARKVLAFVPVAEKILSHESYIVRIEGAKTLGQLGNREAAPLLLDHLSDYDPLVRQAVAEALGMLGSGKSVPYLKTFYNSEQNPRVKKAIQEAVEKITGLPMKIAS